MLVPITIAFREKFMSLAERLKTARESMGIGQKEMAAQCHASYRTWQGYEAGETPPTAKTIEALVRLGFNANWLMTGDGDMKAGEAELPPGCTRPLIWENEEDLGDSYYLIPRYDVHADCGGGAVVESEQVLERLAFVKQWVNAHHQPSDLFLISAQGHSMQPSINEGDILLIDKSRSRVTEDGIYILSVDHELIAKRLQRLYDGSIKIVSDNKAYPEQLVPYDQVDKLIIVGRVVWKGGRM
jgi:phage repressor protein C with HTH and peptisase S24 domain